MNWLVSFWGIGICKSKVWDKKKEDGYKSWSAD